MNSLCPPLRSRKSDYTENGDSWFHAPSHPGDARELWGTRGAGCRRRERRRKRKRNRERRRKRKWNRGQGRGGNRAQKLSTKSVPKNTSLFQPEPCILLTFSLPLHLKLSSLNLRAPLWVRGTARTPCTQHTEGEWKLEGTGAKNRSFGGLTRGDWMSEPIISLSWLCVGFHNIN